MDFYWQKPIIRNYVDRFSNTLVLKFTVTLKYESGRYFYAYR